MSRLLRFLFRDNPMTLETTRIARRFLSVGSQGQPNRRVNRMVGLLLAFLYLWIHVAIAYFREDLSAMLLGLEFVLLTLAAPASVYAAISGERERLTWDSLIMTRLSPARILAGKLAWRFCLMGAIVALFTPPLLASHFLDKHGRPEFSLSGLLLAQAIIASWGVLVVCFTLLVSAKTKRSVTTLAVASAALFGFLLVTPALQMILDVSGNAAGYSAAAGYRRYVDGRPYGAMSFSPMAALGEYLVWANPFASFSSQANANTGVGSTTWSRARGVAPAMPLVYLFGSALCVGGTLRALKRLGLPTTGSGGMGRRVSAAEGDR